MMLKRLAALLAAVALIFAVAQPAAYASTIDGNVGTNAGPHEIDE